MYRYLIIIYLFIGGCGAKNTTQDQYKKDIDSISLTQQQLGGVNIKFTQYSKKAIKTLIHANGILRLLPENKSEISSHISGKIEKIFVYEGMKVSKGQALISISSFDLLELQNDYITAKSEADFQAIEYKRQEELNNKKVGVLAEFQLTKSKYLSAQARERSLKQKLELLGIDVKSILVNNSPELSSSITITAPISGYVNRLFVNKGTLVSSETILAEVIDPSELQANIYVYEKDINLVKEDSPVQISFLQKDIPPTTGKIVYISKSLDPENKTITLYAKVENKLGRTFMSDMNIKAIISSDMNGEEYNVIPSTAVYDDGEAKYVFVTEDTKSNLVKMKKIRVEILKEDDDFLVIKPFITLPENIWFADNNLLALEAERKKNE